MQILYLSVLAFAACSRVAAHTLLSALFVDDINQGDGACIRMPKSPENATFPVINMTSWDMACGFDGSKGVARVCPVPQAGKLSFLFRIWPDGSQPGAIDPSHMGPCAVYMKYMGMITSVGGHGPGWFKIYDEGYDMVTKQWCTEKLIKNSGFLSVRVPKDLVGGDYLVRTELLALHEADKTPPQPQFYIGCAQISLNSTASSSPVETVAIPGHLKAEDPSVLFNIWNNPKFPYHIPGPTRYVSGKSKVNQIKQDYNKLPKLGRLPKDAILTNGNWWTAEVPSYVDSASCYRASKICWQKTDDCYKSAPPTGSSNCRIWETHCTEINEDCNISKPSGPRNAGRDLNPPKTVYKNIPPAANDSDFHTQDQALPEVSELEDEVFSLTLQPSSQTPVFMTPSGAMPAVVSVSPVSPAHSPINLLYTPGSEVLAIIPINKSSGPSSIAATVCDNWAAAQTQESPAVLPSPADSSRISSTPSLGFAQLFSSPLLSSMPPGLTVSHSSSTQILTVSKSFVTLTSIITVTATIDSTSVGYSASNCADCSNLVQYSRPTSSTRISRILSRILRQRAN